MQVSKPHQHKDHTVDAILAHGPCLPATRPRVVGVGVA
jgi:hypothetical protein